MIDCNIKVELGDRSYPIYVGRELGSLLGPTCQRHGFPSHLVIVTDRNVASHLLRPTTRSLETAGFDVSSIVIPAGEGSKTLARAQSLFTYLLKRRVTRQTAILALGGGVIGDLAGFVASTLLRGLPVVQIPTTLLSQVDSAIGGKTGVNHPLGKNMIGTFHQPAFVWTDSSVLGSLPKREILCGLGEIVKYGIILSEEFFSYTESHLKKLIALDTETVLHVLKTCCGMKADLVARDERDRGGRIILNFGHTIGHALEAAGRFKLLKHGEAVLLGIAAESFIAKEMGLLAIEAYERICSLVRRIPLPSGFAQLPQARVLAAMDYDKKSLTSAKRFVLPLRIGEVTVSDRVPLQLIRASLSSLSKSTKRTVH